MSGQPKKIELEVKGLSSRFGWCSRVIQKTFDLDGRVNFVDRKSRKLKNTCQQVTAKEWTVSRTSSSILSRVQLEDTTDFSEPRTFCKPEKFEISRGNENAFEISGQTLRFLVQSSGLNAEIFVWYLDRNLSFVLQILSYSNPVVKIFCGSCQCVNSTSRLCCLLR